MSTTLPLFWNISSNNKKERIDASVKLIGALERFQAEFAPQESTSEEDDEVDGVARGGNEKGDGLDVLNAADVSYSIRRLVRGLASPRESSRLGFAVALTELLLRIDSLTCSQVVALIVDASRTQGSSTGQEERDVLFARLFGLTAVIQSGLITRDTPLSPSASSSTTASDSASFASVVSLLLALADEKSWLRESAWWSLLLAVDRLDSTAVPWKSEAMEAVIDTLYVKNEVWTAEKVALTVKLQSYVPSAGWKELLSPTLKQPEVLASGNFAALARIIKDVGGDDDNDEDTKSSTGSWSPKVPFVWDILLDEILSPSDSSKSSTGSFPEFFRVLVDESLFATSSSPERKYWGFQVFRKSLSRAATTEYMPMLFTKNFMRTWINHLSNSDRYLHKAAKQVSNDILDLVKQSPKLGFTLILQLTGVNGSQQFDKLTKTKTVETILSSMNSDGIQDYIDYLLQQVNDKDNGKDDDVSAINARRLWIVDQLAALLRNGAIPKNDAWVQHILDWLLVHALCMVQKKSAKSNLLALHTVPSPQYSENLHEACRSRLLSSLAELTAQTSVVHIEDKAVKVAAVALDGQFWTSKCLSSLEQLLSDKKHLRWLAEIDEEDLALRHSALQLARRLNKISGDKEELARGTELLLSASLLRQYCSDNGGDEENEDSDALKNCVDAARRLFPEKKDKKAQSESDNEPIDVLIDVIIRFLEMGTTFMKSIANQTFTLLSGFLLPSSIDLIVAQLVSPDPAEDAEAPDDDMNEDSASENDADDPSTSSGDEEASDEEGTLEENAELRAAIEETLKVNGLKVSESDSDEDSDEDLMDDDQMVAIDEQLAAVFKARADEKGRGTANVRREETHFKNRVLDLVDVYLKKHACGAHATRLISPLAEIITGSGSDEKQLTDKATGIIRSRLGKTKDIPPITNKKDVIAIMQELHMRARTAVSSDILATLSSCCLYLAKGLWHVDEHQAVIEAYRESLADFMTRKASRLNKHFFEAFFRRYAALGWELRHALIEFGGQAVNGYRRAQAYQLLQTVMNQSSALDRSAEILAFMPVLARSIDDVVTSACDDDSLTPSQTKEILKLAQSASRQTKRLASTTQEVSSLWKPPRWLALAQKLAGSNSLKSSTGLQNMCKQVAQLTDHDTSTRQHEQESFKRKFGVSEDLESPAKPAKRKKVKKTKA